MIPLNLIVSIFEIGNVAFAILYFIFSLIVIRQIFLMTDTLITEVSPLLRILGLLHSILALGIIILFIFFF